MGFVCLNDGYMILRLKIEPEATCYGHGNSDFKCNFFWYLFWPLDGLNVHYKEVFKAYLCEIVSVKHDITHHLYTFFFWLLIPN